MSLEELDGFLSALVVGPEVVPTEVWGELIWGKAGGAGVFADGAQAEFVARLLNRHVEAIGKRLEAGYAHEPLIGNIHSGSGFSEWAAGFMRGMDLADKAWRPLIKDRRRGAPLLAPILYAATGDAAICGDGQEPMDGEEHLSDIAQALLNLAEYWRLPPELRGPQRPARAVPKPGRNQPCPCGSGKKYKRCCGSELAAPGS
jgi:uncharacterized protein